MPEDSCPCAKTGVRGSVVGMVYRTKNKSDDVPISPYGQLVPFDVAATGSRLYWLWRNAAALNCPSGLMMRTPAYAVVPFQGVASFWER